VLHARRALESLALPNKFKIQSPNLKSDKFKIFSNVSKIYDAEVPLLPEFWSNDKADAINEDDASAAA